MAIRWVHAHLVLSPDPQTGIWCDGCATPARVRFQVTALTEHGVSDHGTIEQCLRCDGYDD
jgi:hypothetical protein